MSSIVVRAVAKIVNIARINIEGTLLYVFVIRILFKQGLRLG